LHVRYLMTYTQNVKYLLRFHATVVMRTLLSVTFIRTLPLSFKLKSCLCFYTSPTFMIKILAFWDVTLCRRYLFNYRRSVISHIPTKWSWKWMYLRLWTKRNVPRAWQAANFIENFRSLYTTVCTQNAALSLYISNSVVRCGSWLPLQRRSFPSGLWPLSANQILTLLATKYQSYISRQCANH
jgi:hypothetical protein